MKTFVGWQTVLGSAKPRDDVKRSQMNAIRIDLWGTLTLQSFPWSRFRVTASRDMSCYTSPGIKKKYCLLQQTCECIYATVDALYSSTKPFPTYAQCLSLSEPQKDVSRSAKWTQTTLQP
ncbi:uncharacterized protein LACBIDRAFT_327992 [Laccaria bicolor S238N-H82]|uniref:Predicted protein n=1 Tax=Laccaria bicolor (strain S238N-H82 / ATCC MYA-4686) TaxID=486041 RepID=B0DDH1_LACBS|nr:uncharacterized protein LACBIDRAFT_327992 [Laccaria bicolor S238N-H82]EDR07608.1 predicted protein [Laccaria bicolor S238N-H82]|eukprot:XP_001882000.1 predicted protein [Laccaria bicolor S238N-H82]